MGSGTDNIDELRDSASVFFTKEAIAKFYADASQEGAEIWTCQGKSPWYKARELEGPQLRSNPRHWDVRMPKKWYDNIPIEGILCWVWDGKYENPKTLVVQVVMLHDNRGYVDSENVEWDNAEPVKPEECYHEDR